MSAEETSKEAVAGDGQEVAPARDLLVEAVAKAGLDPAVVATLTLWLEGQLQEDQYTRLEQVGQGAEGGIPLARVFVDLAVGERSGAEPAEMDGEEAPGHGAPEGGFVHEVLKLEPRPIALGSVDPMFRGEKGIEERLRPSSGFVLVGGPGQGKTTVGQFLCQVHRAALLAPRKERLNEKGRRALAGLVDQCAAGSLSLPATGAIPFPVVLRELAPWLEREGGAGAGAMFRYLSTQVRRTLDDVGHREARDLASDEIRRLMVAWPSLVILDGLDEVPASAGRSALLEMIREFLQALADGGATGLVLATTRPQGYANELAGLQLEERYLSPLTRRAALRYAERLVSVRFGDRPDQRRKILDRLRQAAEEEATARLLRSPLQVTLMATLVERIGRAPSERWSLFRDYYRIIYEREMERGGHLAEVLRSHRPYIDRIHARVGLLLQVASESADSADALMSRDRLAEVIDAALAEEGVERAEREALAGTILQATVERVVLLVQARQDRFGFEIRSLQEFMAAWELTSRSESLVEARLAQIARAASFRNVLLFAASKAFTELSALRDALVERICPALNEAPDDEVARVTLAGSVLALELLEEGSALNQPKYARRLMELAVKLLELPASAIHVRLARVVEPVVEEVLRRAIEVRMQGTEGSERLVAWVSLIELTERPWAWELADAGWPDDGEEQRRIVDQYRRSLDYRETWSSWLRRQILGNLEQFPPQFLMAWPLPSARSGESGQEPDRIDAVSAWAGWERDVLLLRVRGLASALYDHVQLVPVDCDRDALWARFLASMPEVPATWRPWNAAARFAASPSACTLADVLDILAWPYERDAVEWLRYELAWPLDACLCKAKSAEELQALSRKVRAGALGDCADWKAAEERWREQGVELNMFGVPAVDLPFDARDPSAELSPYIGLRHRASGNNPNLAPVVQGLIDRFSAATDPNIRARMASFCLSALHQAATGAAELTISPSLTVSPALLEALIGAGAREHFLADALSAVVRSLDAAWIEALDGIGRRIRRIRLRRANELLLRDLLNVYREHPERKGLLHVIAALLLKEGSPGSMPLPRVSPGDLDVPHLRDAAALIALARSDMTAAEVDDSVSAVLEATTEGRSILHEPVQMVQKGGMSPSLKERALLSLAQRIPVGEEQSYLLDVLDRLARRKSGLDDNSTWDRLQLPLPRPQRPQPRGASVPASPPPSPQIETLQIEKLRLLDTLNVPVVPRDDGLGQWLVFLGENGVGKSTLLRALVFALADDGVVTSLLAQSHARWRHHPAGNDDVAQIVVMTRGGRFLREIEHGLERDALRPSSYESPERPLVFAYGCRRGSALGGPDRGVSLSPLAAVATLFDEPPHLIHAETWLKDRALAAEQEKDPEGLCHRLFHTILEALKKALPNVDDIAIRDRRVWVRGPAVGEAPLSALSDGYLTTAGWVIDLIARWIESAELREQEVPFDFLERMTGVVLVDEIDLHLHPRWQCEVIRRTRELFPRMTFIVTTHNPLTLFGARPGEIFVLRRKEQPDRSGAIERRQIDLPKGVRADQILTGPWFGLESVLEPETLALLDEHRRLLAQQDPATDGRRRELEATLRERLGTFADTALDRLALSVAAELMTEEYRELSPDDRAKLRDEVKRRVDERRRRTGQSG